MRGLLTGKLDALKSYNDGPVDENWEQMDPFYEIESFTPALVLGPGETDQVCLQ